MFALARMGGVRAFSSMISQIRNTRLLAIVAPMMVESGAAFCAIHGRLTAASPYSQWLSMVISATSTSSLPLEWRDVTRAAVARLVIAITVAPHAFAASATSMVIALRPDTEWISSVSSTEYLDAGDAYTSGDTFKKPVDFNQCLANYDEWLENIAVSNVPIFMVHCYYDTTIYYGWTQYAYNMIKSYRDDRGLDGDIYCGLFEDVSYPDETYSSAHWSWIKMLNGDVYASTNASLDTITWFKSLSTSTNDYQLKTVTNPVAGEAAGDNIYAYNLIATVTNSGEKITALEIDMNGKKVDASKLTTEMFKITGYNSDASGLVKGDVQSYGIFGSEDEPVDIEVARVSVNEKGNIILDLATQNGVLNYTSLARNLATKIRYKLASVALPMIVEDNSTTNPDDKQTAVKTGDDLNVLGAGSLMIISLMMVAVSKRKFD